MLNPESEFNVWFNQEYGDVQNQLFGDLIYKMAKRAYFQGRKYLHNLVMETWNAPYTEPYSHIADKLKELK